MRMNKYPSFPIKKGIILTTRFGNPFICNGRFDFKSNTIGAYGGMLLNKKIFRIANSFDSWTNIKGCRRANKYEIKILYKAVVEQGFIEYKKFFE